MVLPWELVHDGRTQSEMSPPLESNATSVHEEREPTHVCTLKWASAPGQPGRACPGQAGPGPSISHRTPSVAEALHHRIRRVRLPKLRQVSVVGLPAAARSGIAGVCTIASEEGLGGLLDIDNGAVGVDEQETAVAV